MPSFFNTQSAVGYQLRLTGFRLHCVQSFRIHRIHIRCHGKATQQRIAFPADGAGKLTQDPFDFFLFFGQIAFNIVIQVHHSHRLDEQRGSGSALVVNNTGKIRPVLLFNRNHIPVSPHGYQCILKVLLVIRIMQYLLQL